MIQSLLDNDLYKFTMGQAVFEKFPNYMVEYEFTCRNDQKWTQQKFDKLNVAIKHWCKLKFTAEDLEYLYSVGHFKPNFLEFLRVYQPNIEHITTRLDGDQLRLKIKGPWYLTIFYEVPLLAMINEVYFENAFTKDQHAEAIGRLQFKATQLHKAPDLKFADFGTRRRLNFNMQRNVVSMLSACPGFVGTSNVYMAKMHGATPIGTMAHEWFMAGAGRPDCSFENSQKAMLQTWTDVYRGDLGIALTDTYGMKAFERDFDLYFANLYSGLRHDSGDPIEWAHKAIDMYKRLGIDPTTKHLVFSDGLTVDKAIEINNALVGMKTSFGIGTHFTNDVPDLTPLSIVIKMTYCNGHPTIKISDEPAKTMCKDEIFKAYAFSRML